MTDLRKAAEMALEALEEAQAYTSSESFSPSMTNELAIRAAHLRLALEQPQTPDDLLRQSEREGWRYAKECEAEVKRLRQALEQPDPVEAAVLAEREACAKLCESMRPSKQEYDQRFYTACTLCANAIRARGE